MAVVSGFFGLGGAGFRLILVLSNVVAECQQAVREVDVLDDGVGILDLQLDVYKRQPCWRCAAPTNACA